MNKQKDLFRKQNIRNKHSNKMKQNKILKQMIKTIFFKSWIINNENLQRKEKKESGRG